MTHFSDLPPIPESPIPHYALLDDVLPLALHRMLWPLPSTPINRFKHLQEITGGLRPHEFSILCGATGVGKTTLCANLSVSLLEIGVPQFVASVETGPTDYVTRMISVLVGKDWNTGDVVPRDQVKTFYNDYQALLKKQNFCLSLYENRFSVETLIADIKYMIDNHKIKVAIIDNLNFFMEVTAATQAVVEMDRVVHELIMFCKQAPIHVIMVMHPKKSDSGRVESEFDIKGSSTAVQEAHNVFLWNRPHPDLIKSGEVTKNDRELKIAKMRRKGKYVGARLIMSTKDFVSYQEKMLFK